MPNPFALLDALRMERAALQNEYEAKRRELDGRITSAYNALKVALALPANPSTENLNARKG